MEIKNNDMTSFGGRLNFILKTNNLNNTQFAKMIKVDNSHIGKVIKNKANLSSATIQLICNQYKINEKWLMTGEGEIYTNEIKDNSIINKLIIDFNSLSPELQNTALEIFSSLCNFQRKININTFL